MTRPDTNSIYAQLRADIAGGVLPPGRRLPEVALAERFGVSRTPVREALLRLQHDRLLIGGSRGLEVRSIEAEEVIQVYELRLLLEAEASGQAAHSRGASDLARLEGLLARDRALNDPEDATRMETNREFHAAIWKAAHNAVLEDLLQRLTIHLVHSPRSTLSVPGRWQKALDEHAALFRAIDGAAETAARRLAADHVRTARELRLALLRNP